MPPAPVPTRPTVAELVGSASSFRLPLRGRFRGVDHREGLLLRGPAGWGEFAPFPEYDDAEAARWLAAAIEAAWDGWPDPVRDTVPVNATVPAVAPGQVAEVLARYDGCRTAKVKVAERGQHLEHDVDRVAEVRRVMGAGARIRVDANGGWSTEQAREAVGRLAASGLEYVEQPCARVAELAELRRLLARDRVDVPVAADESIRRPEDPMLVVREQAADLIVVKVAPLGGVVPALRLVAECGLPAVVSSSLDTSVGIAAGVALAAALPQLEHACGLGTVELLGSDVAARSLVPVAGMISVTDAHRLVRAEPDLADLVPLGGDREQWWRDRLERCAALLDEPRR